MTERVVDILEAVEVQAQDSERLALLGALGRLVQTLVEQRPVWQPRQRVVTGGVGEPLLRLLALGNIYDDADGAGRPTGLVVEVARAHLQMPETAVAAPSYPAFAGDFGVAPLQGRLDRLDEAGLILRQEAGHPGRPRNLPFDRGEAEDMAALGAAFQLAGPEIAHETADPADAVAKPKQFLALYQPLLDLHAFGDVLNYGDTSQGRAVFVAPPNRGADPRPDDVAVGQDVADFSLPLAGDLHRLGHFDLDRHAIVGMNDIARRHGQQQRGVALEDLAKSPVDAHEALAAHVHLANAGRARLEQRGQRRVLLGQGVRDAPAALQEPDPRDTAPKSSEGRCNARFKHTASARNGPLRLGSATIGLRKAACGEAR